MGLLDQIWDEIVVFFRGKQIAILGPRGAGKTTLWDYIQSGSVASDDRPPTQGQVKRGITRSPDVGPIKKGTDVGGQSSLYPEWEQLFRAANIVFYVFDAGLLRTDADYARRVTEDSKKLKGWGVGNRDIYLLGTHRDADIRSLEVSEAAYYDELMDNNDVIALRARLTKTSGGSTTAPALAIGSLASISDARQLLSSLGLPK